MEDNDEECHIFMGHFPQKSPRISGSYGYVMDDMKENDGYESRHKHEIVRGCAVALSFV